MNTTRTIRLPLRYGRKSEPVVARETCIPGLIVTPLVSATGAKKRRWVITHAESGYAISPASPDRAFPTLTAAMESCRFISMLNARVDWTHPSKEVVIASVRALGDNDRRVLMAIIRRQPAGIR